LPDEADNHILEIAVAGRAAAIVTRNKRDFLRGELRFPTIRIAAPHEVLREIN
jgi:predicted nucleic acid-binding protein